MFKAEIKVSGDQFFPTNFDEFEIYRHAVVKSSHLNDCSRSLLIFVDPTYNVDGEELLRSEQLLFDYPYDWALIQFDSRGEVFSLEVSRYGSVPLFFCVSNLSVYLSWDPLEVIHKSAEASLNIERAAIFLETYAQPYSHETIINNVYRIPAGYKISFKRKDEKGIKFGFENRNIEAIDSPRTLYSDENISSVICNLIQQYSEPWCSNTDLTICSHLSGGNDSGVVSAIISSLCQKYGKQLNTSGIIVTGKSSHAQSKRRDEYVKKFQLNDHPIYANSFPVLGKGSFRFEKNDYVPWTDGYREAFYGILKKFSNYKNPVMFTGAGGDELSYAHWSEMGVEEKIALEDRYVIEEGNFTTDKSKKLAKDNLYEVSRAYTGLISPSSVEDSGLNSFDALRLGVFPVTPFCDVETVRFFRWLPLKHRKNRNAIKQLLIDLGISEKVAFQREKEDFSDFMERSISDFEKNNVIELLKHKNIDRLGLINSRIVIQELLSRKSITKRSKIYAASILEGLVEFILKQKN